MLIAFYCRAFHRLGLLVKTQLSREWVRIEARQDSGTRPQGNNKLQFSSGFPLTRFNSMRSYQTTDPYSLQRSFLRGILCVGMRRSGEVVSGNGPQAETACELVQRTIVVPHRRTLLPGASSI
jgi:hypothetical protein